MRCPDRGGAKQPANGDIANPSAPGQATPVPAFRNGLVAARQLKIVIRGARSFVQQ
jgi:hypothetical protein